MRSIMCLAKQLPGGLQMWIMLLYLYINQNQDDDWETQRWCAFHHIITQFPKYHCPKLHTRLQLMVHHFGLKVTRNDAQYPLHNKTYTPAKSKVATSNDAFTRENII